MAGPRYKLAIITAIAVALTSSVSTLAVAQDAGRTIANNDSILIDGRTFGITHGTSKQDISGQIKRLGAREIGPGAIIFRSGDKLYMVDAALLPQLLATRYDPAIERQRPLGLGDVDIERQRPQGLRGDVDIERQRAPRPAQRR